MNKKLLVSSLAGLYLLAGCGGGSSSSSSAQQPSNPMASRDVVIIMHHYPEEICLDPAVQGKIENQTPGGTDFIYQIGDISTLCSDFGKINNGTECTVIDMAREDISFIDVHTSCIIGTNSRSASGNELKYSVDNISNQALIDL